MVALGFVYGVTPNLAALLGTPRPATAGALVDRLASLILFRAPLPAERDAFLAYLGLTANAAVNATYYDFYARHLTALVASAPAFQKR